MRYERLKDIIDLAVRLQGSRAGVTLDEIQSDLSVSRRTAERMRDAVEWAFGPLETVPSDDNRLHWRLRSKALRCLLQVTVEEQSALATAAAALERTGLQEQATK
ncbi:MAG: DNA-binding transcriptional regulator, partial [Boseongicola sp. SB0662_bin_57]|nr:DNA-binding transcriptional regulator [Boseongicola sp. SB0662_bin_57]